MSPTYYVELRLLTRWASNRTFSPFSVGLPCYTSLLPREFSPPETNLEHLGPSEPSGTDGMSFELRA